MAGPGSGWVPPELTAAQRRVVEQSPGALLVQAGPGSGKTTVLVARALRLLAGGTAPRSLWIVTFTVAARQEVRRRLSAAAGAPGAAVRCGTFHAYAYGLLRAGGPAPRLLQEVERLALLRRALAGRPDGARRAEVGALDALSSAVSLAVNTGAVRAAPSDLPDLARMAGLPAAGVSAGDFPGLLADYRAAKEAEGVLDLDDLPWAALDLLDQRPALLAAEREATAHILVDEFQDINLPQWLLVDRLAPAGDSVLAVGDPDQAIYAFRGASPAWMREFPRRFPGCVRLELAENFRSRPPIVAAANRLMASARDRVPFVGRPTRPEGPSVAVSVASYPTPGAESRAVAAALRQRLAAGCAAEDLAVLYRTNTYPAGLLHLLRTEGVPARVLGGAVSLVDHWVARDIAAYLRLAADPADHGALRRVANRPNRYLPARALEAAAAGAGGTALDRLARLADLAPWQRTRVDELRLTVRRLAGLPPAQAVQGVLREAGYLEHLRGRAGSAAGGDLAEWLGVAEELASLAAGHTALPAFLAALSEGAGASPSGGDAGVTLATIHASKGLEFDVVLLMGCGEGLLPHRTARADAAAVEEERRLCYVAFTRAREELQISFVQAGELGGGPSRFLGDAGLMARPVPRVRATRRPRS